MQIGVLAIHCTSEARDVMDDRSHRDALADLIKHGTQTRE